MVQRAARLRCKGHPTGVTTFIARYRVGDRQQVTTIGWTHTLQAEAACKRPRERMGRAAVGVDETGLQKAARRAATVNNLAARVLEIYLPHHPKETTQLDYRKMIERFIIPRLGRYKVAEPDRTKIAVFHHSISATPYQAHRALAALSVMLLQAETWGMRPEGVNPCLRVRRFREKMRERFRSSAETARPGGGLENAQALRMFAPTTCATPLPRTLTPAVSAFRWSASCLAIPRPRQLRTRPTSPLTRFVKPMPTLQG